MLIAVAGLAGAGKTTACEFLDSAKMGRRFYAGVVLHEELRRRGLEANPKNERFVRSQLRQADGEEVFARRALPKVEAMLAQGPVFLDAVYCQSELVCYRSLSVPVYVMAIETARALRVERLAGRDERSMSDGDLAKRDELELGTIGLGKVLADANFIVRNDGNLVEFEEIVGRSVAEVPGFPA